MDNEIREFSYETMMKFLNDFCPIKRINNKGKWSKSLVIEAVYSKGNTQLLPITNNNADKLRMMNQLYNILANIFGFNHDEISIVVANYVGIDD